MPTKPSINLTELIGKRGFGFAGLQDAHIIAREFYSNDDLDWIGPLLPNVDDEANYVVLPESERGSAILGVAAHYGFHNGAFNRFFFANDELSGKFLDRLKAKVESPSADLPALRIELLNFLDFTKVLFLYDELQTGRDHPTATGPRSLEFNSADPRFAVRDDVAQYYEGGGAGLIQQDLLDDAAVRAHPVFTAIARARANGATINDVWLVNRFPELSRMLYPDGKIVWATGDRDKYQGIQADILAREAVLSGVIALVGGASLRTRNTSSAGAYWVGRSTPGEQSAVIAQHADCDLIRRVSDLS